MEEDIRSLIYEFVGQYSDKFKTLTRWDDPLVAYADARDPLFDKLKIHVGTSHKTPIELLEKAKTVICYFLPFTREIPLSNVKWFHCSKEWAKAYIETNKLISDLNLFLAEKLEKMGSKSIVLPSTHNFDEVKLQSDWSHKHVGYIAGLGKFGLHQMLITEKGCCGRLGSLITSLELEPTEKQEGEFCLFKYNGTCGECVENCVFEALKTDTFDKHKCHEVCRANDSLYTDLDTVEICGKCVCVVPCSFENPVK